MRCITCDSPILSATNHRAVCVLKYMTHTDTGSPAFTRHCVDSLSHDLYKLLMTKAEEVCVLARRFANVRRATTAAAAADAAAEKEDGAI